MALLSRCLATAVQLIVGNACSSWMVLAPRVCVCLYLFVLVKPHSRGVVAGRVGGVTEMQFLLNFCLPIIGVMFIFKL